MGKKRAEVEISKRCCDFLINKYGYPANIFRKTKIKKSVFYGWQNNQNVISTYYLQYLTELGADPKFLLTGGRGDENENL